MAILAGMAEMAQMAEISVIGQLGKVPEPFAGIAGFGDFEGEGIFSAPESAPGDIGLGGVFFEVVGAFWAVGELGL